MNNYKKQKALMDLMDDSMHKIEFTTTGQMRKILETQANWFDMTLSEYVNRSLWAYMEIVAQMAGYNEDEEMKHWKEKYPHND